MVNIIADTLETIVTDVTDLLHRAHAAGALLPLEIDDAGHLRGDDVEVYPESPKQQALAPGLENVEAIAWHWTDTRGCGAANLAKRIASVGGRSASWHAVIDATGHAVQSVSAKRGSWHVGSNTAALFRRTSIVRTLGAWEMIDAANRGKVPGYGGNSFMYGIELECVGEVRLADGKWCGWPFKFGTQWGAPAVVPADEVVIDATGIRGHHAFTGPQIVTAERITRALVHRYALTRDACSWGHCQIDPSQRTDPGPLWLGPAAAGHGLALGGHLANILDRVFGA